MSCQFLANFLFLSPTIIKAACSGHFLRHPYGVSLVTQQYRNLPAMQEMLLEPQVQSLGLEDALENEMATHSSILPWKIS